MAVRAPRRLVAATALAASLAVTLLAPATPSRAADDGSKRVQDAQAALEDSSAAVQAAGAVLARTAALLPGARAEVARTQGELAGAQARVEAAGQQVQRGQVVLSGATAAVDRASASVVQGRSRLGRLARRSYELGPLQQVRTLTDSGPAELLQRAGMLQRAFRGSDDVLRQLAADRYVLAGHRTQVAAAQAELDALNADAARREQHAQAVAATAQQAQDRLAGLVAEQRQALAQAESSRASDAAEYKVAQDASARLKAQIRAAAAAAAARAARARAAQTLAVARAQAAQARAEAQARAAAQAQALADARALAGARAGAAARALADARATAAARAGVAERANAAARSSAAVAASAATSASALAVPVQHTGRFLWPADGPLTSRFGWRMHPIFHVLRLHAGIDIGAAYGAPVSAADAGVVTFAGESSGYGTLVVISHGTQDGRDISTAYAHMSQLLVGVGQHVGRGQQVGAVGTEGNSTGPHLHFEVRLDGSAVDPLGYVSPP